MSFAARLYSYPDGFRQSTTNLPWRGGKGSGAEAGAGLRSFRLPSPPWLQGRVESVLPVAARQAGAEGGDNRPKLSCLAHVAFGCAYQHILTPMTEEEELLFQYLHYPSDFFCLKVLDCCRVEEPFYVGSATAERFNRDAQGYVNQKVASSDSREASRLAQASMTVPFLPYAPEASLGDAALLDAGAGATAQEALSTWQVETSADTCFLAIPVPGLLLELLACRAWPVIPCLGRWLNVVARLPRSLHPGVCEKGLAEPQPHLGELSVGQLSHMIRLLRAWAPVLVREHPGQESSAETERCLQDAVQWLVNVRSALPGQQLPASGSKRMYSSLFLVKCMLMSRLVPSYVNLKELCLNAMDLLFPSLLRSVIDDLADSKHAFPGKSSKHVMRLVLDVAMLLSVRRDIELDDYVRFGGADSSPQHGHNWLLSSYWSVPTQDLASLFFAAQALTEECKTRALEPEKYEQSESSRANHAQLAQTARYSSSSGARSRRPCQQMQRYGAQMGHVAW